MSEIGTLTHDRFILEQRLGSGSTGTVWAAFDKKRRESVALKILSYRSASALYRLKREFRTLVDVIHPNLVTFYELFADEEDEVFFTMELVDGTDILTHVRRADGAAAAGFDEGRLRAAFGQLAAAVAALHAGDKIHCDLKPNNVLVDRAGRVVILDFGIARDLAPSVTPQSLYLGLSGTVPYMSPEQARGVAPPPASDWYAVGVMLFEALTGRMPFEGSLVDVLSAKVSETAPAPRQLQPEMPGDLADLCADLLETEPRNRPSGAEVLARLGVAVAAAAELQGPPDPALAASEVAAIGRGDVLAALRDAFESSRRGHAVTAYVHGESGMGKSELVHCFLRGLAETSDAVILAGRCYERELVPFKALDGVVDSLSRYLSRRGGEIEPPADARSLCQLFPVLRRLEPFAETARAGAEIPDRQSLRRRAFAALRELLGRIAAEHPLVLFVDDLHWADVDSTALIHELLRPPESPPLLLLASFRSEEIGAKPFLGELLREAGTETCREVELGPLDDAAAAELARAHLGAVEELGQLVAAIVREAQGSPFFIEQLVDYARATESTLSSAIGLGEMLDARLAQLGAGAAALVTTLAAAGRPLDAAVAYAAAGLEGDERPLLASLKAARMVRASGSAERVELFHNRLRENLAARLDAAGKRRLHARLAATLVAHGHDDPEALFEHFRHSGQSARAGAEAVRAAAKAREALAFDHAARFYRRALELGEHGAEDRRALLAAEAESLSCAGRPGEAARAYLELAAGIPRLAALQYRQKAAQEYMAGGYFDDGLKVVREVGREVDLDLAATPARALTSLLWHRARLRFRGLGFARREASEIPREELLRADASWLMAAILAQTHPVHGSDLQTRHLLLALDAGEPVRISRALSLEASYRSTRGALPEDVARLRQIALELARGTGDAIAEFYCLLHTGVSAYLAGRWREGAEWCEKAEAFVTERHPGGYFELHQARRYGLSCRAYLGDLGVVSRRVPELLAEARERGNVLSSTELATRLNVAWLARDDPRGGRRAVDDALAAWSHREFQVPHFNALVARCQADLYCGDREQALSRLEGEWPRLRRSLLMRLQLIAVECHFLRGRAALAAAEVEPTAERLRLAGRAAARVGREKTPYAAPMTMLLTAGLACLGGEAARSAELLEQAARAFESAEMALHAAAARRRRGQVLGREEGMETIAAADAWMRSQGIERPRRMTALLVPGFADLGD